MAPSPISPKVSFPWPVISAHDLVASASRAPSRLCSSHDAFVQAPVLRDLGCSFMKQDPKPSSRDCDIEHLVEPVGVIVETASLRVLRQSKSSWRLPELSMVSERCFHGPAILSSSTPPNPVPLTLLVSVVSVVATTLIH